MMFPEPSVPLTEPGETVGEPVYEVYGLRFASPTPLLTPLVRASGPPRFRYECHAAAGPIPAAASVRYRSRRHTQEGVPALILRHHEDTDYFCLPSGVTLTVRPDRVDAYAADLRQQILAEICLLGTILSYLREGEGVPVLHAAVVAVGGRAVAFLAGNGGGKSSLAAALVNRGCPLVSDDLLPILDGPEGPSAAPGYPQMRLWPREAGFFLGDISSLERVHPDLEKLRAPVGPSGFGSFHAAPLPLAAIYLPERRPAEDPGTSVEIHREPARQALAVLSSQLFLRPLVTELGWMGARMQFLARLVRDIPVRRLRYPSGLERLDPVVGSLLDDLNGSRQ